MISDELRAINEALHDALRAAPAASVLDEEVHIVRRCCVDRRLLGLMIELNRTTRRRTPTGIRSV